MAQWHLDESINALGSKGWQLHAEIPGDERKTSAAWVIHRGNALMIDFEGLDDLSILPVEWAHACAARNSPHSLFFSRRGTHDALVRRRWLQQLKRFVESLDTLVSA
ncbi:hypothetical protein [Lysobacter hankyongensis]|uniref:Uncharacterized protein n=1 Tax=Lysobacter hankyongensis TaxID=1176535 RepID=A0ABP9B6R5_9GAMM